MIPQISNRDEDIKQLNFLLKDEKAAVETYQQCLEKMEDAEISAALIDLQLSHQQRAKLLSEKVRELGGSPESHSGIWGSFAKAVEGTAKIFGKESALSALEEGEDRGIKIYQERTRKLSPECRLFIDSTICPEQLRSHRGLNRIIESLH